MKSTQQHQVCRGRSRTACLTKQNPDKPTNRLRVNSSTQQPTSGVRNRTVCAETKKSNIKSTQQEQVPRVRIKSGSYGLSGFRFVRQAVRVRPRQTWCCCADLVVILFLGSQYDFVLEKSSLGGCSYVLSGFCFASQPDRQHEVVLSRVAAVYHDFLFV